jgi:hypothetical protein
MTDQQKISDIIKRREYFDSNFPVIERCDARQDISYRLSNTCPSCGYLTLDERCSWDICTFCFWEDDGQDNYDADKICGGPNSDYSLTAHRLEVYDWMIDLKANWETANSIEKSLGQELTMLDDYISKNETNGKLVLNQIELLARLFSEYRNINSDSKPSWKFLTEKQMTEIKPTYNN